MKINPSLWLMLFISIALSILSYQLGKQDKQEEIEERTKDFPFDTINESQLEIIIFGEVQL